MVATKEKGIPVVDVKSLNTFDEGYAQYYDNHMRKFALINCKNKLAGSIFMLLGSYMNKQNSVICSQEYLVNYFNVTRQSIWKALKILTDEQYMTIKKTGKSVVYCLNSDIIWRTDINQRRVPTVQATVLLDNDGKDWIPVPEETEIE